MEIVVKLSLLSRAYFNIVVNGSLTQWRKGEPSPCQTTCPTVQVLLFRDSIRPTTQVRQSMLVYWSTDNTRVVSLCATDY